jgi:hypothetical protein
MKVLIKEPCVVDFGNGGVHAEAGETVDVDKDQAITLCITCNRGLFINEADDPTKGNRTATDEDIARVKKYVAQKKAEAEASKQAKAVDNDAITNAVTAALAKLLQAAGAVEKAKV